MRTLLGLAVLLLFAGCGGRSHSEAGRADTGAGGTEPQTGGSNGSGAATASGGTAGGAAVGGAPATGGQSGIAQGGDANGPNLAEAGQGGSGGTPSGDSAGAPDLATAVRLFDQRATVLQVEADRSGHALVSWDDGLDTGAVSFNSTRGSWSDPVSLGARNVWLVASAVGTFPAATWTKPVSPDSNMVNVWARRFDYVHETWTAPSALPVESWPNDWDIVADAGGDLLAFWRTPDSDYFSRWPLGGDGWDQATTLDEAGYLVAGKESSFYWSERNTLLVQTYDRASATWSDAIALRDLTQETPLRADALLTGRDDTALMVSVRRDPDAILVEAWRKTPFRNEWGDAEVVMTLPAAGKDNILYGPDGALPDPDGDLVWVSFVTETGDFELDVARYDPTQATWSVSRTIAGGSPSSSAPPDLELFADDLGRVYGSGDVGLTRFDRSTLAWNDSMRIHVPTVLPSAQGAFAIGWDGKKTSVIKSDAGADWRRTSGLPSGTKDISYFGYNGALLEPERAVLVWEQDYGDNQGVWAATAE